MKAIVLTIALVLVFLQPLFAQEERGPMISMELRDVPIKDVLRALSQEHGINIIVDDSVSGNVTVSLKGIPLWDAIESILKSKGYTYRIVRTGLLLVEPLTDYEKKEEYVVVREFKLKYLRVSDKSVSALNGFLSGKGQIIPVESTNSLIVKDIPQVVDKISSLIGNMDIQPAQIMIEARIVEVSSNFRREFGINWSAQSTEWVVDSSFSVNVPLTGGAATGSLGLGYIKDNFSLNAVLSALEDSGAGKILSSPRIRVLENQEAQITSGTEIVVPSGTSTTVGGVTTTSVERVQATLSLSVTPRAVSDDKVAMIINTKRDEFDFGKSVLGIPPKDTREAKTQLIVKDGETIVIGGIYRKADSNRETRVPFLSKIPLLGWLFKSKAKRDDQLELLIFITPTIIKETETSGL
ncbi:MAG: hypothetical protein HY805_06950 [Nitrospirae bacterium]|nr:hypothetical protein [Nitrospirota bacterium]